MLKITIPIYTATNFQKQFLSRGAMAPLESLMINLEATAVIVI